jgi:hypothetical protein
MNKANLLPLFQKKKNLQIISLQKSYLTLCAKMTFHTYLNGHAHNSVVDLLPRRYFHEILQN